MAMLVVLLDARSNLAALDAATADRLAGLGVTHVTIARDKTTEAIVLEDWAFDVAACGAEAASVVAGHAANSSLQPVMHTLLTRDPRVGEDISEKRPEPPRRITTAPSTGGPT